MYVRVLEPFCANYVSEESRSGRGFDPHRAYRVHKIVGNGEDGHVVLVNDDQELCWVDSQHVRVTSEDDFSKAKATELDLPIRIPQSGPYTA